MKYEIYITHSIWFPSPIELETTKIFTFFWSNERPVPMYSLAAILNVCTDNRRLCMREK